MNEDEVRGRCPFCNWTGLSLPEHARQVHGRALRRRSDDQYRVSRSRYVTREEAFRRDLWTPARLALPIVFSGRDRVYFDAPAPPTA